MAFNLKTAVTGIGCLLITGCSTLEQFGLGDLNSVANLPTKDSVSGGLDSSRLEGAMSLAKAATLSNEEVVEYARSFATMSDKRNKIAPANSPYTVRLNNLVKKHLKEDGLNLNFKVYLSPEINAFAMADGTIRVYSGLMDRMKDDELLFVIGHEIGHVKNEHIKSQLQKAYATHAILSTGAGELKAATGGTAAGGLQRIGIDQAENILKDLAEAQFSQGDETEADEYGLKFIKRHSYDSSAAVRALLKLAEVGESESSLVSELFSSHPDAEKRAMRLKEQLEDVSVDAVESSEESAVPETSVTAEPNTPLATFNQAPKIRPPYTVQVEAAKTRTKAEETLANYKAYGFPGEIQEVVVDGTMYFRVLIGYYNSFSAAKSNLFEIQNTGLCDGQPFVKKFDY